MALPDSSMVERPESPGIRRDPVAGLSGMFQVRALVGQPFFFVNCLQLMPISEST